MARSESKPHTILVLTLAAMLALTVTPAALAEHNSLGGEVHIIQADEYNRLNGTLERDIPVDSPLRQIWHDQLEDSGLPGRIDPVDQRGAGYTDCVPRSEFGSQALYENALPNYNDESIDETRDDACYVGLLDAQIEYRIFTTFLLKSQPDNLYVLNPTADDDYCNAESQQEDPASAINPTNVTVENQTVATTPGVDNGTTPGALDQPYTRAVHGLEDRCNDNNHRMFIPSTSGIDINLLEPKDAAEAAGTNPGSGTFTIPTVGAPYAFVFGQPHPESGNQTGLEAGDGVFGPDPVEMGGPFRDLTGACGMSPDEHPQDKDTRRTGDCELLDPESIRLYDTNLPSGISDEVPRVCVYTPTVQWSSPDAGSRLAGVCGGLTGRNNVAETFLSDTRKGGLDSGAVPSTYVFTQPGWYWGALYLGLILQTDSYFDLTDEPDGEFQSFVDDYLDDEKEMQDGFMHYWAVNPAVPDISSQISCLAPGILAEGSTLTFRPTKNETGSNVTEVNVTTSAGTISTETIDGHLFNQTTNMTDPGFYGPYQADAIDADVHPTAIQSHLRTTRDLTHDDVRAALRAANDTAATANEIVDNTTDAIEDEIPQQIGDLIDQEVNQTFDILVDVADRADYFESSDPEPHAQAGPQNQDPWSNQVEQGIGCNAANRIEFRATNQTLVGGLRFDVNVGPANEILVNRDLKDPTLLNGTLPAQESDTREGEWQPDVYTFGGAIDAVLDVNRDGDLDACAPEAGRSIDEDSCPWRGLWDAYNPGCDDVNGRLCEDILRSKGYETNGTGVGLFFTLNVTGPTAISTEVTFEFDQHFQRPLPIVIGDDQPLKTNCVVGTSNGYLPHLKRLIENRTSLENPDTDDVKDLLCGDVGGERLLIDDAFNDQSPATAGTYSAAIQWAKLMPTPKDFQNVGIGDRDGLCLNGVWTVDEPVNDDNETAKLEDGFADDTKGNLNLGNATTGHELVQYRDCDPFTTGVEDNPDEAGEGEPKAD